MRRFSDSAVASVFRGYPPALRAKLLALRGLVFDTAAGSQGVGCLTATLRWGQPSYLTEETGSGSTVRIDRLRSGDGYAVHFHRQSRFLRQFSALYPDTFKHQGQRAILFDPADRVAARPLRHCLALAFTRHSRRKKPRS